MLNWRRATVAFVQGYIIATIVGIVFFSIHETAMRVSMVTVVPAVFAGLAYGYLGYVAVEAGYAGREALKLSAYWVAVSFAIDVLFNIVIYPLAFGEPVNWRFLADQFPWIWISYLMLVVSGVAGGWYYRFRIARNGVD